MIWMMRRGTRRGWRGPSRAWSCPKIVACFGRGRGINLSRPRVPSERVLFRIHCHPNRPAVSRRPRRRFQPGSWEPKIPFGACWERNTMDALVAAGARGRRPHFPTSPSVSPGSEKHPQARPRCGKPHSLVLLLWKADHTWRGWASSLPKMTRSAEIRSEAAFPRLAPNCGLSDQL
jgi:hypothetical protein